MKTNKESTTKLEIGKIYADMLCGSNATVLEFKGFDSKGEYLFSFKKGKRSYAASADGFIHFLVAHPFYEVISED